jgi:hypothetical protein
VTNSPVQKIAAAAATRQSVSINPPKFYSCPVAALGGTTSSGQSAVNSELPDPAHGVTPKPLEYFSP